MHHELFKESQTVTGTRRAISDSGTCPASLRGKTGYAEQYLETTFFPSECQVRLGERRSPSGCVMRMLMKTWQGSLNLGIQTAAVVGRRPGLKTSLHRRCDDYGSEVGKRQFHRDIFTERKQIC